MAGLKKEKRGISVKKPFSFNGMEKINPAKNQILNELFAESRQQRSYGSQISRFSTSFRFEKLPYLEYASTKVNSVQTQMASQEGQRAVPGLWRKLLHWISLRTHLPTIPQFTRAR
jgi:hypothetical protein